MSDVRHLHPGAIRFQVEPRDVPPVKAARRLHLTLEEFEERLVRLRARGFPAADPDTGNFDLKAIDDWMDRRSGLSTEPPAAKDAGADFNKRLGAIRGAARS